VRPELPSLRDYESWRNTFFRLGETAAARDSWGAVPEGENWWEWHTVMMRKVADLLRGMAA
jgi:hypothetical protein